MELKNYQKAVIRDLERYLEILMQTKNIETAYTRLWQEKDVKVGFGGMPKYQNLLPGVPNVCLKVPTGGGKTFLAANAIEPIFSALGVVKRRAVVWLVPSDAILTQTLAALRDPAHPYRQKIDVAFGSRVEVYTKEQLLMGQHFNISAVNEQLSIMVLSYDSFRGKKERLKAKQENSSLVALANALGEPDMPLEDTDPTALMQVINQLHPLVIVDESHHARSNPSKQMLQNFNPCFVLDLTATPTKESNIISIVDAIHLKRENMVKLPVIVMNRNSQQDVLHDAIEMQRTLEIHAKDAYEKGGSYIRPIVLFQAQPKGKENATTFEKLRQRLIAANIPAEQIAIKTAEINELKNVDLLSEKCSIRFIITVNALKEGWDCPFAYILASLANRTSQVEVEQIVGRILRLPYTRKHSSPILNTSYVLTSSEDFKRMYNMDTGKTVNMSKTFLEAIAELDDAAMVGDYVLVEDSDEDTLYAAKVSGNVIGSLEIVSDDASICSVEDGVLYYVANKYDSNGTSYVDLYTYANGKSTRAAQDIAADYATVYEDGQLLVHTGYNSYDDKEIALIAKDGTRTVIADGVSWVRRVDKNTTLYISDNDLYSYDGKEKTRLLTDVDQMWCRDTLAGTTIDLGWYGY